MKKIVFVWDNFGPLHVDRCDATANALADKIDVVGIELGAKSEVYDWVPESGCSFEKITLFPGQSINEISFLPRFFRTLRSCLSQGAGASYFLCHYEHPATLFTALLLRLSGHAVFAMGCSKYDDYPRHLWRELLKRIFYLPYSGGLASGTRSVDYMRFLGVPSTRIRPNYNAVSIERIRRLAGASPAPAGIPHCDRSFVLVARFVPKKNVRSALEAFAIYARRTNNPRSLHLCGSGPLEAELKRQVRESGLESLVHLRGFLQTGEICQTFASSLALLLPSVEEQFGNVVPEALAMGVPVILSDRCGARDRLVRSGLNGFVVEPDNPEGMALFMEMLATNESLWKQMSTAAAESSVQGDAKRFAESVCALLGSERGGI
ncbi:glycosyltransferase [Acidobacteria bacterium AB60]|nr:glycosyltransferase [Acidobacteria bacterium AB60]